GAPEARGRRPEGGRPGARREGGGAELEVAARAGPAERGAGAPAARPRGRSTGQRQFGAEEVGPVRRDVRPERAVPVPELRDGELRLRPDRRLALREEAERIALRADRGGPDLQRGARRPVVLAVVAADEERVERGPEPEGARRGIDLAPAVGARE